MSKIGIMIDNQASQLINQQIGHEFFAFYQYVALSTWLDAEALPVLSNYFALQAEEERQHGMKMIKFLNDTDQTIEMPAIPKPKSTFASVEQAIQMAYEQEIRVTDQIKAIYDAASQANDRITQNFMQWFLEEQVEEVASMDTLLKITRRADSDLFRIEDFVAREGHPEQNGE